MTSPATSYELTESQVALVSGGILATAGFAATLVASDVDPDLCPKPWQPPVPPRPLIDVGQQFMVGG
jgi:hypothetical protein